MGVGSALSSLALSACVRKPKEKIVPFSKRPEDLIPGKPRYYATSAFVAGSVLGLVAESQDGRPTKLEGNPKHPGSGGAASAWAQAEVLNLYDVDRPRAPSRNGKDLTWDQAFSHLDEVLARGGEAGKKLALVTESLPSPTFERLLDDLVRQRPETLVVEHDLAAGDAEREGFELVGLGSVDAVRRLDRADVIVALDADLFGVEADAVRTAGLWAKRRRMRSEKEDIGRLYVVEPCFSVTGSVADNRLRLPASGVAALLDGLTAALVEAGLGLPSSAEPLLGKLTQENTSAFGPWVPVLAKELMANHGKALLVAGRRQPAQVHAIVALLNQALGSVGTTLTFTRRGAKARRATLAELAERIDSGSVEALVVLGGNPVYDAPRDLGLAERFRKVPASAHLSLLHNETSEVCGLQVPRNHFLESWGDLRASDGTLALQQPLIAPLYDTLSEIELLARLAGYDAPRGYELVKDTWRKQGVAAPAFERSWRRWLHDGVAGRAAEATGAPAQWDRLARAWSPANKPEEGSVELDFALDSSTFDGRFANNPWLQELPDPTTKLAWDHAAYVSDATAAAAGIESGDVVRVTVGDEHVEMPVLVVPGTADGVLVVPLGYGRSAGRFAKGVGVDTFSLRTRANPWIADAKVARTGKKHQLCTTQDHARMEGRPIVRETTLEAHRANPGAMREVTGPPLESLWKEPNRRDGQQWGMSIDLSACTGCNACVMACQAENNIPVVGRDRVLEGREMHWIRLDRYFQSDGDAAVMSCQPMACTPVRERAL